MPTPTPRERALASLSAAADGEEERIAAGIAADPDSPELPDAFFRPPYPVVLPVPVDAEVLARLPADPAERDACVGRLPRTAVGL